jgi:hypothetical protein
MISVIVPCSAELPKAYYYEQGCACEILPIFALYLHYLGSYKISGGRRAEHMIMYSFGLIAFILDEGRGGDKTVLKSRLTLTLGSKSRRSDKPVPYLLLSPKRICKPYDVC